MTSPETAPPAEPTSRPVDTDYQASIDSGLTESFEDFCQRISKEGP